MTKKLLASRYGILFKGQGQNFGCMACAANSSYMLLCRHFIFWDIIFDSNVKAKQLKICLYCL